MSSYPQPLAPSKLYLQIEYMVIQCQATVNKNMDKEIQTVIIRTEDYMLLYLTYIVLVDTVIQKLLRT